MEKRRILLTEHDSVWDQENEPGAQFRVSRQTASEEHTAFPFVQHCHAATKHEISDRVQTCLNFSKSFLVWMRSSLVCMEKCSIVPRKVQSCLGRFWKAIRCYSAIFAITAVECAANSRNRGVLNGANMKMGAVGHLTKRTPASWRNTRRNQTRRLRNCLRAMSHAK